MSVLEEAELVFTKLFSFQKSSAWVLPNPDRWSSVADVSWDCPELTRMKADLNKTKSLLNDMEPIAWRRHTSWTNRAANVLHRVRRAASPDLLTQAWCKFYELLHEFGLARADPLRSFHLCEAPGAFIAALQHYLRSEDHSQSWVWYANTLNPYYEGNTSKSTVTDDRLISGTLNRWYFGKDQTGDIMSPDFKIESFLEKNDLFDLVTADGSIDCQDDPAEQESIVAALHAAEALAALRLLADDGHFVLKMFTFFEACSISLLFLLNCVFEKVHVKKPACSKPGNSEVYVVCSNFRMASITDDHTAALAKVTSTRNAFCFASVQDLPEDFLRQVDGCTRYFKDLQEATIRENLSWFQNDMNQGSCSRLQEVKETVAALYVDRYHCIHTFETALTPPLLSPEHKKVATRFRGWNLASFAERSGHSDWWKERIGDLRKLLSSVFPPHAGLQKSTFRNGLAKEPVPCKSWIQTGRGYSAVPGLSAFCRPTLLDLALMLGLAESVESLKHKKCSSQGVICNDHSWRCADLVLEELRRLESGQDMVLRLLETLSRFSVGLLFLLSSLFRTTSVSLSNAVGEWPTWTFSNLNAEKAGQLQEHLADIVSVGRSGEAAVLEVVPFALLRKSKFVKFVMAVNDTVLCDFASRVLSAAEKDKQRDPSKGSA